MITTVDLIGKFQYALVQKWGYIWGTAGVKWTAEKQKELEKTTDSDRAQGRKYGSKWINHIVADCSGLFAWAFRKLGGEMYHGSNTMYLKWCTDKGELKKGARADGKGLKPGTAVFVWNGKNYSHVGLFIGDGKVIEAKGTQAGVVTSKVTDSKWTHWGELKGVDYSNTAPEPVPKPVPVPVPGKDYPTLRKGSTGEYVQLLQTKLLNQGYDLGKWGADGQFGAATEKAVKQFQKDWGLKVDGIVGKETWQRLNTSTVKVSYSVTIRGLTKTQADELSETFPNKTTITQERG